MALPISFVIPALNEGRNISKTLLSIQSAADEAGLAHEVVLVDHGSADDTSEIARRLGARVIEHRGGTIATLRNVGAAAANGDLLVFLDADVELTRGWARWIREAIDPLLEGERRVTGSHCSPPESRNPLLRYWFRAVVTDPRNTHLGSAHLILAKPAFDEIGGFDGSLRTGEDYDFCERARKVGFSIDNDQRLEVIHPDYPRTLTAFMRREMWHGAGDGGSLGRIVGSKVAIASLFFLVLHVAALTCALLDFGAGTVVSILLLAGLLLGSSAVKSAHVGLVAVLVNSVIFYFYFWSRCTALLRSVVGPNR